MGICSSIAKKIATPAFALVADDLFSSQENADFGVFIEKAIGF